MEPGTIAQRQAWFVLAFMAQDPTAQLKI